MLGTLRHLGSGLRNLPEGEEGKLSGYEALSKWCHRSDVSVGCHATVERSGETRCLRHSVTASLMEIRRVGSAPVTLKKRGYEFNVPRRWRKRQVVGSRVPRADALGAIRARQEKKIRSGCHQPVSNLFSCQLCAYPKPLGQPRISTDGFIFAEGVPHVERHERE